MTRVGKSSATDVLMKFIFYMILVLFGFICAYPFLNMIAVSLSKPAYVVANKVFIFPVGIQFANYRILVKDASYIRSYGNTILYTSLGTTSALFFSIVTAYPLSKKTFPFRGVFMKLIVFTMFFSGGLIPTFLVIRGIGMYNTLLAIVIPNALVAWNVIILRTAFMGVPSELGEAVVMDGGSDLQILTRVFLPLSVPTIAVIALYSSVGLWNDFFTPLVYLNDSDRWPLSVMLRQLVLSATGLAEQHKLAEANEEYIVEASYKATALIISTLPILMVYPFIQKYFVKGVLVGSVKG